MSDDPEYRDAASQSGPPDALHESDRAMLSAVSHRQRDTTPLSLDQERLLESWVAGRLPSKLADRAAELTKSNKLAAEYVLERRLTAAADEGPDVPSALSARILRASRPAPLGRLSLFNLARSMFNAWKWPGMGVAVAASIAFIVVLDS